MERNEGEEHMGGNWNEEERERWQERRTHRYVRAQRERVEGGKVCMLYVLMD